MPSASGSTLPSREQTQAPRRGCLTRREVLQMLRQQRRKETEEALVSQNDLITFVSDNGFLHPFILPHLLSVHIHFSLSLLEIINCK